MTYHEDFSDRRSGWPDRVFPGFSAHYIPGGYRLFRSQSPVSVPAIKGLVAEAADSIVAYGPWWGNFRASARVEAHWLAPDSAVGMAFDVMERGYYAFVLDVPGQAHQITFELVEGDWSGARSVIIPWTPVADMDRPGKVYKLSMEQNRGRISLAVDGHQVGSIQDAAYEYGLIGISIFDQGSITVHDLLVQAIP